MPGQGRLTLKGARRPYRPDLDRLVPAAASDEFAISTEADRIDPVLETSQHVHHGGMNSSNTAVINSPVGVPGQRRLALARLRIPHLDRFVRTPTAHSGHPPEHTYTLLTQDILLSTPTLCSLRTSS